MKKVVIYLILFIAALASVHAQNLGYGLKAGVNLNNLNIDPELDPPDPNMRFGFHVGGFVQLELSEYISFQPEVLISTQGANDEDDGSYQRVKLTYLNVGGMFKYTLDNNVNILAGPQYGFLAGGEFEEEDKVDGSMDVYSADNVYKENDFSLGFGVGYTLENGLDIGLRYYLGLTDNNEDPTEMAFYEPIQEIKSRVLQLTLGYALSP